MSSDAPSENRAKSSRIPELDGLRGTAILLVVLYHYFFLPVRPQSGWIASHLVRSMLLGRTGVDLFFVLSGFLIGGILIDAKESENYFRVFYVRRFFRIVPLYAFYLLMARLVVALVDAGPLRQFSIFKEGALPWTPYLFFLQNFWMPKLHGLGAPGLAQAWSLAVEEQFYLTLPLAIHFCSRRTLRYVLIGAVVFALILRTALTLRDPASFIAQYVLMPCRVDALAFGVLAALIVRSPGDLEWIQTHVRGFLVLLIVFAVGLYALRIPPKTIGYTWVGMFYAALLLQSVTQKTSIVARFFRLWPLRFLGGLAYGIYLLHFHVLILLSGWIRPGHAYLSQLPLLDSGYQFGIQVLAFALAVGICWISWNFFEKPLVQVGHRFTYTSRAESIGRDAICK